MIRLVLIILLVSINLRADCVKDKYWTDNEEIFQAVCSDDCENCELHLGVVRDGWARVLVNRSIIYYLSFDGEDWQIMAKGPRFDLDDWEKLGIPSSVR